MALDLNPSSVTVPRLKSLDCLRGVAALGVVIWHYQFFFHARPLYALLLPFYTNGQLAVDTFFVISGFVLSYVYAERVITAAGFRFYIVKRIARLYPLHAATLFFTAGMFGLLYRKTGAYGILYVPSDAYHFVLNLALLQYVGAQVTYSFNGPAWSISTEFWINMLFGALLAWRGRFIVPISLAIIVGASATLLYVSREWSVMPKLDGWIEVELIRTAADFFCGVLVHQAWRRWRRVNVWGSVALGAGAAITLAAMCFRHSSGNGAYLEMVSALVGGSLLVWGSACSRWAQSIGGSRAGRWIGDVSYSIYMWHFPVALVVLLLGVDSVIGNGLLLLMPYLFCVLTVAHVSFRYLEQPARRWVVRRAGRDDPRHIPMWRRLPSSES
jgi:peptidoglycan/LPS O-acetylase OafA/YrhL